MSKRVFRTFAEYKKHYYPTEVASDLTPEQELQQALDKAVQDYLLEIRGAISEFLRKA